MLNREQIKIKQIQDPFSENCIQYARRTCILITSELLQAHLIVSQNSSDHNQSTTAKSLKKRQEIEDFKNHCLHLANWGQAELFYIFTVCNLVQTNDTTKFFRERVLQIALRILQAEVYLHKYLVNCGYASVKALIEIIKGRFEYKRDLTGILMDKIRHYELINPMEVVTFHHIHKLEQNFVQEDEHFDVDQFLSAFNSSFTRLLEEMREEPIQLIKEELLHDKIDLDGIIAQGSACN